MRNSPSLFKHQPSEARILCCLPQKGLNNQNKGKGHEKKEFKASANRSLGFGRVRELLATKSPVVVDKHIMDAEVETVYVAFEHLEHGGEHSLFKNLNVCYGLQGRQSH